MRTRVLRPPAPRLVVDAAERREATQEELADIKNRVAFTRYAEFRKGLKPRVSNLELPEGMTNAEVEAVRKQSKPKVRRWR